MPHLDGKTALLTGGTGCIGRELARGLLARGAHVILACRDLERGAALARDLGAEPERVTVRALDLAQLTSVRALARWALDELEHLDVLIHNAAVWSRQRRTTADGFELTFATNHLGPFALTTALLPLLRRSAARVVTVASGMHGRGKIAWDDPMQSSGGFNGVRAYEQSKLANVMFALALARRAGPSLVSNAVHPGVVRSGLTREYPELWKTSPPQTTARLAANASLRLVAEPGFAGCSGRYFDRDREQAPAKSAQRVADQDRLWSLSEQLLAEAKR